MFKVICFGEILWDIFPEFKTIGGAPLNVALRLHSFNSKVSVISSVGNDVLGKSILEYISNYGVSIDSVQINNDFETGTVNVFLDESGSASYDISFPCAWDYIYINDTLVASVKNCDAFVFGSLASRNFESKATLIELLKYARYKVFDINLRAPHYNKDVVLELMCFADFIKMNEDELLEICGYFGLLDATLEVNLKCISELTKSKHICITRGERGAILLYDDIVYENKGYKVQVKDTVGAGDSFLAVLIRKLFEGINPQNALDFACAVGALVAKRNGANPVLDESEINALINLSLE